MTLFFLIFNKLLPLYVFMILGYCAGKFLKIDPKQIGSLVIYIIMPVVFAVGLWQADIALKSILIVIPIWGIGIAIAAFSYFVAKLLYNKETSVKNLIASGLPTGNSGYFGIPVALAVLDETIFAVFLIAAISNTMFQITIGYYLMALGRYNYRDSLVKLLKLPALYGAIVGGILSFTNVPIPQFFMTTNDFMKASFTVLGMMIIGLTFAAISNIKFDFKFLSLSVLIRFLIWPVFALLFVLFDYYLLGAVYQPYYKIIALFSLLPIGADFAIYATQLNIFPQRAASAILVTTLIAALLIPLFFTLIQ